MSLTDNTRWAIVNRSTVVSSENQNCLPRQRLESSLTKEPCPRRVGEVESCYRVWIRCSCVDGVSRLHDTSHVWITRYTPRPRGVGCSARVGSSLLSSEFLHRSIAYACALLPPQGQPYSQVRMCTEFTMWEQPWHSSISREWRGLTFNNPKIIPIIRDTILRRRPPLSALNFLKLGVESL